MAHHSQAAPWQSDKQKVRQSYEWRTASKTRLERLFANGSQ
ncbi:hypothetical protein SS05631_c08010 [Sinorhizobium sp. CCBAU 05631]|nr:hypothetical protein SS05631_c08010 [Sinorhizobium sp. CCBAU 05631]